MSNTDTSLDTSIQWRIQFWFSGSLVTTAWRGWRRRPPDMEGKR
jgi:hypothetical protein